MEITLRLTQEQIAVIRQSLMCAASVAREHDNFDQVQEIHNIRKAIPDPWFPSKPELRPLRDVSNLPVPVTIVEGSVDGTIPDEYVCRACGVRWVTFEAARECDHDERFRALEEIKNLEQWKPDNWEYKVLALKIHYVN